MQVMAQGWVMSTLTDKAIMLGMVNFAAGLPMIFLTMFGGSVADQFDKRRILVWTQVVQIALALLRRLPHFHRAHPDLAHHRGRGIVGHCLRL